MKKIKNPKDLLLSVIMLAVSLYLLLAPKIVRGMTLLYTNIPIAKAATYVRILGGALCLLSAILLLRSLELIKKKGAAAEEKEVSAEKKPLDWLVVSGFIALLVYVPLMNLIGFIASSIIMMTFFTFIIRAREKKVDRKDKKAVLKNLGIAVLYAVILVAALSFAFTTWLHVRLP